MHMMLNNNLGFKAMKTLKPEEIDVNDFWTVLNRYIQKMLDKNPDEHSQIAKDIIDFCMEYSDLSVE